MRFDSGEECEVWASDDPAYASDDQSERNDVRQYRVAYAIGARLIIPTDLTPAQKIVRPCEQAHIEADSRVGIVGEKQTVNMTEGTQKETLHTALSTPSSWSKNGGNDGRSETPERRNDSTLFSSPGWFQVPRSRGSGAASVRLPEATDGKS
jgi:hypothetical protein